MISGRDGCATQALLAQLAGVLRRSTRPVRHWLDERGRAGAIAGNAGLLPEDVHDGQPLVQDNVVFACRARLDNRDEVSRELSILPTERAALADSAIMFQGYLKWGVRCAEKLFGDYTFAAWHLDSGKLVAAVDHLASSPLYYANCDGTVVVAGQLAVVLAHPKVARDLNIEALGALIGPKSIVGATPYRAVHALPPGHLMIVERDQVRLEHWWLPQANTLVHYRDPRDYVANASVLFEKAVEARLRTTGKIATTLSGGLDSTLVTATAARLLAPRGGRLTAYTAIPDSGLTCIDREGWDACDFGYAAAVARMYANIRHRPIRPQGLCPLDLMPSVHAYSRTPVRNGANHLWLGRISLQSAQSGARVVLTGQRGNFSVSASGRGAVEELLWSARPGPALQCALELHRVEQVPVARSLVAALLGPARRRLGVSAKSRFPGGAYLSADFLHAFAPVLTDSDGRLPPNASRVSLLTGIKVPWFADPLVQWDVEWRDPTSDRRLVEYLLSLPLEAFTLNGRYRGLARAMGERLLPESVRQRRTQGSQVPEHSSMLTAHAVKYQRALAAAAKSPLFRSICDLDEISKALRDLAGGSMDRLKAQTVDRALDVGLFIAALEAAR